MIRPAFPAFQTLRGQFSRVLLTCEHASNWVPEPWCSIDQTRSNKQSNIQSNNQSKNQTSKFPHRMTLNDVAINQQHWGIDIGAALLTQSINQSIGCPALLATISRLVIDVNRPLNSPTLMRTTADNQLIDFNQYVDQSFSEHDLISQSNDQADKQTKDQLLKQFLNQTDRQVRINEIYIPYHQQLLTLVNQHKPRLIMSVHSFTPLYEGQPRSMEIGVLFNPSIYQSNNQSNNQTNIQSVNQSSLPAQELNDVLIKAGFDSRINEPWSGIDGYMYAVESVSNQTNNETSNQSNSQSNDQSNVQANHQSIGELVGRPTDWVSPIECTLMIEVRQDLAMQPEWRDRVTKAIIKFIKQRLID